MPMAQEDQDRLPPMISCEDVAERQRLQDLKSYRRYLADSGVVECLVKMYKHAAKHEMRIDNPELVTEFLAGYSAEAPASQEVEALTRENAELHASNSALMDEVKELERALEAEKKLLTVRAIWQLLTSAEFWDGVPEADERPQSADSISVGALYRRLCGQQADSLTGAVPAQLVQPQGVGEASTVVVSRQEFCEWAAGRAPGVVFAWCRDELLPRLGEFPAEPPFEQEVVQAVGESAHYPGDLGEVANTVQLDPGLETFLEVLTEEFGGSGR